jgi:hypothetical protein
MSEPINHEEAEQLAQMKRGESNLARCYLDMKVQVTAYEKRIPELCAEYIDKLKAAELQVRVLREFYEWSQNTGSWSDVSTNPEDGCRLTLTADEAVKGGLLAEAVDEAFAEKRKCPSSRTSNFDHRWSEPKDGLRHCHDCYQTEKVN